MSAPAEGGIRMPEETSQGFDVQHEADLLLLEKYVPASVVVDTNLEILHLRGHTGPYLELAPGKVSRNLVNMARGDLGLGLRSSIDAARKENHAVRKEGLQVSEAGAIRQVRVTVEPLQRPSAQHYFLVLFEEMLPLARPGSAASASDEPAGPATRRGPAAHRIAALQQELTAAGGQMAAMLQEYDAANEELRIANEELQNLNEDILVSNEELQNLNEELETSKEELQALNDELAATNQQLETRNRQLKDTQEYVEAIVETVREPLMVLSADLRVERANTAFYQFFRVVPHEIEGRFLYNLGNGQWNLPRLRTLLEEVLATNQSIRDFEVEHDFPTIGHKILLLGARRMLRGGKPVKEHPILLAMEDITERKEVERQKDAFLGMVSHELRIPVSSAKLYAHLLQEHLAGAGDEQSFTDLARIDTQLEEFSRLINDLLDATALGAGVLHMHPAPFVVDDLVRSIVETMGHTHPSARLLLEGETHIEAYADPDRIRQVLLNLLSNAINYSPQTEPVRVRVSAQTEAVTISVQDRGVGIPLEQQARIFERFYRAAAPKQGVPSLGLGLYIAAQIVKQQGGGIWMESEPGKGSTFSFTIPRRTSSQ